MTLHVSPYFEKTLRGSLAGSAQMIANPLIPKYLTNNSLFLKDLRGNVAKPLIPKDRTNGVGNNN
jgi:hypothetical protein